MKSMKYITLVFLLLISAAQAQSPQTVFGSYSRQRINDSVPQRAVGSFVVGVSVSQTVTFILSIDYAIEDINNDSDIQGWLEVDNVASPAAVDLVPGPSQVSRRNHLIVVHQTNCTAGNHTVGVHMGRIGSVDAYDIQGRWVCTAVKYGEYSQALIDAMALLRRETGGQSSLLQTQIDSLAELSSQRLADLQARMDDAENRLAILEANRDEYAQQIANLQSDITRLETEMADSVAALELYVDTKVDDLRQELSIAIADGDSALAAQILSEVTRLESLISTLSTHADLESLAERVDAELNRLSEQATSFVTRTEVDRIYNRLTAMERENDTFPALIDQLRSQLQSAIATGDRETIERLQRDLSTLEKRTRTNRVSSSSDGGDSTGTIMGAAGLGLGVFSIGWQIHDAVRPGFEEKQEQAKPEE